MDITLGVTPRMQCSLRSICCNHPKKVKRPQRISCKNVDGGGAVLLAVLIAGLGGATGGLAAPIQAPDLRNCSTPSTVPGDTNCCPPYRPGTVITDFQLPQASSPLRVRTAAHLVDREYLAKYEKAVGLMKKLPADDPRSFAQQWRTHCAYCDAAYDQVGFPGLEIQVHNSWLFLPWHRFYLYFYERILGKLIGDDTFALPFCNWDAPAGMTLPVIHANKSSPLYDERRNPAHQPPFPLDLDYSLTDPDIPKELQVDRNLKIVYRQMIQGAKKTQLFLGQPYRAGDQPSSGLGTIEGVPHYPVHMWTGDPRQPNGEDVGNFYSAARDPVFFTYHSNIDRMWHIWRGLRPSNTDFTDPDWLDANFLFYDEEARLVRVRVRDCLDTAALRYTYQDVPLPWVNAKPTKMATGSPAPATGNLPATLDKTVRVTVTRPKISRGCKEKDEAEEVLLIEGIELAADQFKHAKFDTANPFNFVKFDVYVNASENGENTAAAECAGSFVFAVQDMSRQKNRGSAKMVARFGISDLLDEIGADGDKTIVVSLVPRSAGEWVTVGGVSIGYSK